MAGNLDGDNAARQEKIGGANAGERLQKRGAPRQAVARPTAVSLIYRQLQHEIISMKRLPGKPLNEKSLTEQFGVSRTPIREALIRLAEEGLVEIFPQSGTFVARIPVDRIPEAVVIRKALEGATVERAAAIATPADIASLDDIIARQQFHAGRGDLAAFHEEDEAYHEAIAAIAGFPGIWQYLKPAKMQIDRARRMTLPALGRMSSVIAEHGVIRDAMAVHDAPAALAAMMTHLTALLPDIDELRKTRPEFFI